MTSRFDSNNSLVLLSRLLFSPVPEERHAFHDLSRARFEEMLLLAGTNHVLMRSMGVLRGLMADAGDGERYEWATNALEQESCRIENALTRLHEILQALGEAGCEVTVIKSLDHWPDLGSDLDLYTNAPAEEIIRVMTERCNGRVAPRSWGDRLANKWNFMIPGLPELVEVHIGRLGQTGELVSLAHSLPKRARKLMLQGYRFPVSSLEDRLVICTLQRMYRHFFIRLCDIADTFEILQTGEIDFASLRALAEENGIWEGLATLLVIVAEYVEGYRGQGVPIPSPVRSAAQLRLGQVGFARGFLRVPILPHSVRLYAGEWKTLMSRGQLRNTARLSLLPCLATAAALGQKITGSDKGIW